jgi:signal transduction histidine kinase
LFGLTHAATIEPPYTMTFAPLESRIQEATAQPRWVRSGDELHGEVDLPFLTGGARARVEVGLHSLEVLLQRGTLVLLLDLLLFSCIWALAVAADGSLFRWLRARRYEWMNSYRVRLTFVLFGFFVIPAMVFAFWSHRGVLAGDRQSRELLVNEMLLASRADAESGDLVRASMRLDAPLFLFERGRLAASSDSLFLQLAPLGRRLPPPVFRSIVLREGMEASHLQEVGGEQALVGYRTISLAGPTPGRAVLAAPARADHSAIDRRRRDLGVLVLFSTAVGALAALLLSGFAARQLARPIGVLRGAALAIARGERDPQLPEEPRSEFAAVFTAFRAMANDLNASRGQLLEAQRRTQAILRNVASGVIAFDGDGCVTLANPRSAVLLGMALEPGASVSDAPLAPLQGQISAFILDDDDDREFDQEIGGRQMHCWLTRLHSGDGGAVLTLDDVSEVARAQRVIAWGQMARQVAHEIKNPLTPIRLGVQHLRRAHTDKRADFDRILDANVARILAEIDRLDEIARAFSRYGVAPAQTADTEPIDVGDVARDVVALERMGEGDVEWRYEETEGSLVAIASEDELREVLLNLLENARHAGARVVTMNVVRKSTTIVLTVDDDGHGIPAEVLPRIFEPHFSTRSSGSGLGLPISRKLIEGWGGNIRVESTPGKGARVTILLLAPLEL